MEVFGTLGLIAVIIVLFFVILYYVPVILWFSALVTGVRISLLQLVLMRIRKVPPSVIVRAMIEAHKAGLQTIKRDELEAHFLAGGNIDNVVHAWCQHQKQILSSRSRWVLPLIWQGEMFSRQYRCL